MKNKSNNGIGRIINAILGLCTTLFSIGFSVIVVLNLTGIYKIAIEKFNLPNRTGVSTENLIINYKGMISYLGNPFIDELKFNDFAMSVSGKIHFEEVKAIFMDLYIIMILSVVIIVVFKLIKKISKHMNVIEILNYSANITLIIFGVITTAMAIDFSKSFVIFHNIFFDNNYWIFDPITDPIINALPEMLFMVYALIIIGLLLIKTIIFKFIYYKKKS